MLIFQDLFKVTVPIFYDNLQANSATCRSHANKLTFPNMGCRVSVRLRCKGQGQSTPAQEHEEQTPPGHAASLVKLSQTPPDIMILLPLLIQRLHRIQFNIWHFLLCLSLHWTQNALRSAAAESMSAERPLGAIWGGDRKLGWAAGAESMSAERPLGATSGRDQKLGWAHLYFSPSANLCFSRLVSFTWIWYRACCTEQLNFYCLFVCF